MIGFDAPSPTVASDIADGLAPLGYPVDAGDGAACAGRRVAGLWRTVSPWGVPVEIVHGLADAAVPFVSELVPDGFETVGVGFGRVVFMVTDPDEARRFVVDALACARPTGSISPSLPAWWSAGGSTTASTASHARVDRCACCTAERDASRHVRNERPRRRRRGLRLGVPRRDTVPTEGGYIVNGTWQWSSGSFHGNWAGGGVMVLDPADNPVAPGMATVPVEQVTIKDTWFVAGMQGTASNTAVAENVFVPTHRVGIGLDLYDTNGAEPEPSMSMPVVPARSPRATPSNGPGETSTSPAVTRSSRRTHRWRPTGAHCSASTRSCSSSDRPAAAALRRAIGCSLSDRWRGCRATAASAGCRARRWSPLRRRKCTTRSTHRCGRPCLRRR